jgi:membrane-bound lytic murein transglycosylase D
VTVFADRAQLFPGIEPLPPTTFEEFTPKRFVSMLDLAHLTNTDVDVLAELNPALVSEVTRGERLIPSGYPLRVPSGSRPAFEHAFAQLPGDRKPENQPSVTHRVARGDTLSDIARRYNTTVAALRKTNGLSARSAVRTGQVLVVGAGRVWTPLIWSPPASRSASTTEKARVHIVSAGETLYQIASRYGLPLGTLMAANALVSPDRLLVGMQLAIPIASGMP